MICVDASVAAKWVLQELRSDQARALFREVADARRSIVAPPLLPIEVTNIVRQKMRRSNGPSLREARAALEDFLAIRVEIHNPEGLHVMALEIAVAFDLAATYDAHYVALAQWLGCDLWTDDRRLLQQVGSELSFIHWIGDYVPSAGEEIVGQP